MPNTGKRSAGCIPCRRMKVKCDEQHPTCSRCARASRECQWRDSPSIFRSMNETSEQRALNPRPRPRPGISKHSSNSQSGRSRSGSPRSESSASRSASASFSLSRRTSADTGGRATLSPSDTFSAMRRSPLSLASSQGRMPSPMPPLAPDWPAQALAYYMAEYVLPIDHDRGTGGYMEYLPELLNESPEGGFLKEAARAVALVALGNRGGIDRLGREGRRSYGRSLKGLRESLSRGEKDDGVLAGMMLLGQYELISGDKPASELWQSHSTGQRALISLRGSSQFSTARGRALFRNSYVSLQLKDLARRTGPSFTSTDWPPEVFLAPHGRKSAELNGKVSVLLNQARLLLEGKEGLGESIIRRAGSTEGYEGRGMDWWVAVRSTAEEGWGILGEGEAWEAWAPGQWRYEEAAGLHDLDVADESEFAYPTSEWESEIDPMDITGMSASAAASTTTSASAHPARGSGSQSGRQSRSSSPDSLPRNVYTFCNLPTAANWCSIWVTLSKLIETLLELHNALSSPLSPYPPATPFFPNQPTPSTFLPNITDPTATPQSILAAKMRGYAEKLICSFPFLLGEIDSEGRLVPGGHGICAGAYFALWPLHILGSLRVLSKEERDWVLNRLESVGRVWGIRQADVLAGWRRKAQLG